jgi:hypothetical protein
MYLSIVEFIVVHFRMHLNQLLIAALTGGHGKYSNESVEVTIVSHQSAAEAKS